MIDEKRFSHLKVLLADDQGLMIDLMKGILVSLHCEDVHGEFNGDDVVHRYKLLRPNLVMLDIKMPKKNGLEALGEILAINSQAYVVMVSAESTSENVQTALKAGARGFIVKPYNPKRIEEILDKYLKDSA